MKTNVFSQSSCLELNDQQRVLSSKVIITNHFSQLTFRGLRQDPWELSVLQDRYIGHEQFPKAISTRVWKSTHSLNFISKASEIPSALGKWNACCQLHLCYN